MPMMVDFSVEAAGSPAALRRALDCLAPLGVCCLVGSARKGVEAAIEMHHLQQGRTLRGCIQGDAAPRDFVPRLFEHWRRGELPVERLVERYELREINRAVAEAQSGRVVKPVLRISPA